MLMSYALWHGFAFAESGTGQCCPLNSGTNFVLRILRLNKQSWISGVIIFICFNIFTCCRDLNHFDEVLRAWFDTHIFSRFRYVDTQLVVWGKYNIICHRKMPQTIKRNTRRHRNRAARMFKFQSETNVDCYIW